VSGSNGKVVKTEKQFLKAATVGMWLPFLFFITFTMQQVASW